MSDDLDMKALRGSLANRGQQALLAGCDMLLHCSGDLSAMWELATIIPELTAKAKERADLAKPALTTTPMSRIQEVGQAQDQFNKLFIGKTDNERATKQSN